MIARLFSAALIGLAASTLPALALDAPPVSATPCMPYADFARLLHDYGGEEPLARGMVDEHAALVVFASPDGASWTALAVGTDRQACVVSSGSGWDGGFIIDPKAPRA